MTHRRVAKPRSMAMLQVTRAGGEPPYRQQGQWHRWTRRRHLMRGFDGSYWAKGVWKATIVMQNGFIATFSRRVQPNSKIGPR